MPIRNMSDAESRSFLGLQELLVFETVPVGAEALIGKPLKTSNITVAGTYTAKATIAGLTALEVHLTATITLGTITSSVFTTYDDEVIAKQNFTGVGLLVTATRQSTTLAASKGEQTVVVSLAVTGTPANITFTQAEINGL